MTENGSHGTPGQAGRDSRSSGSGRSPASRRTFLDRFLGTAFGGLVAAVTYPVIRYIFPPREAEAATSSVVAPVKASQLPPNSGRIIRFGTKPVILLRTPGGELRCFDGTCTHLACTVQYREDLAHIWCACHNGHYDLHGRNIAGPPPRPLPPFDVQARGDDIIVTRRT